MQQESWWKSHLGFWDATAKRIDEPAYRDFLCQLALDLELDVAIHNKIAPRVANLTDVSSSDLEEHLADVSEDVKPILVLLRTATPANFVNSASSAYSKVKELLKQR